MSIANLLTGDTWQGKKGPKMLNLLPIFGLAFLALQVLRDCETKFKSRLAQDARPVNNPTCYLGQMGAPVYKVIVCM